MLLLLCQYVCSVQCLGRGGDGGALVSEIVHHLKSVVANGDAWVAADVLAKDVGLFETDGKTKLIRSVCEGAAEVLLSTLSVCG